MAADVFPKIIHKGALDGLGPEPSQVRCRELCFKSSQCFYYFYLSSAQDPNPDQDYGTKSPPCAIFPSLKWTRGAAHFFTPGATGAGRGSPYKSLTF